MKKVISLSIALVMLLLVFTACSSSNESNVNGNDSSKPEVQTTGNEKTDDNELSQEKPTLKVLGFNAAFDPNEDINAADIEKVTGYHVEYFMLPAENADEKLNIELSSGTNYDIIKISSNQYYQLVGQGALQPLDALLDQYGSDLLSAVKESSWKACEYNGETYALPMRKEYNKDVNLFIEYRKDIFDDLGIKTPVTLNDFYEALKTIKAKRPDLIPLTGPLTAGLGSGNEWTISATISSAFGIYNDWQDVNGALVPKLKNANMKSQLSFMNKLYDEGLIDPDWPINTSTTIQEKFSGGKAAMVVCDRNISISMTPATLENFPEAEVDYLLPLIGENGEQGCNTEDKILYFSCVPKNSKNAAHAINFMNQKAKWENFLYLTLGEENVHFSRTANSNVPSGYDWEPIMPVFSENRGNSYWYLNTIDETNYPDMWLARIKKNTAMWDPFNKVAITSKDIAKPDPIGYMPPSESLSRYGQTLKKMENDFYLKVITGAESLDNYDEFIAEWDAAGGSAVTEEVNAWYKDFYQK